MFYKLIIGFFYNPIWNVSCDKVWYFPLWYRVAEYNLRVSCIVWNSGSLWGLKPGWVHLSSRLAAADSGYILPAASIHGPMTSSFSPPRPPLQDFGGALHSRRRAGALPLNPPRPNYRDSRRNHEEMQSYFALIEDVFNTLLRPPWPLYVWDETESPAVGL